MNIDDLKNKGNLTKAEYVWLMAYLENERHPRIAPSHYIANKALLDFNENFPQKDLEEVIKKINKEREEVQKRFEESYKIASD